MSHNRRQVLKTIGAAGAGSALAAGSVAAQSDEGEGAEEDECITVVDKESFSGPDGPLPYTTAQWLIGDDPTTDSFWPEGFAAAALPDRRAQIEVTINQEVPVVPTVADVIAQRRTITG